MPSLNRTSASPRRSASTRKRQKPWYIRAGSTLVDDRARFIAFACFLGLVAFTGGGSRSDIQSLILLRPAAVLFCTYALLTVSSEQLRAVRVPLVIIAAMMALTLLQLVPLPADLSSRLPQGDLIAHASSLAGLGAPLRPLSLDPGRTWNSLFALFVPLAAVFLIATQAQSYRRLVVPALAIVALTSAGFGLLQAIGGEKMHLYAITHEDYPVGLFANKNHQAVMMLWLMLAGSWQASRTAPERHSPSLVVGGASALIFILFPLIILTGSRAGLALSVPALGICGWLLLRAPATRSLLRHVDARRRKLLFGGLAVTITVPLIVVFGILLTSDRQTALARLFSNDPADDLRWSILPVSLKIARDFLPLGSGFGSFEKVYKLYEPSEMLMSHYVNQAHNDLVQIVVEGGLPALAILIGALIWFMRTVWHLWRSPRRDGSNLAIFFGGSIFLWLAASLVDYPLRTPLAAVLVASLTAWISTLSCGVMSRPSGSRRQGVGS